MPDATMIIDNKTTLQVNLSTHRFIAALFLQYSTFIIFLAKHYLNVQFSSFFFVLLATLLLGFDHQLQDVALHS